MQLVITDASGRRLIVNAPTHQEIAIMINASRETVTRVFQVLQSRGVVARDGNSLKIADEDYLSDVAEGQVEPPKAS
jgi:CRP/FNR family cyclic AMP-dependent transcriptional regulator